MKKLIILAFIFSAFTIYSCSDSTSGNSNKDTPPSLPNLNLASPPTDAPPEVYTEFQYTGVMLGPWMLWIGNIFDDIDAVRDGDTWVWTSTNNDLTITIKATVGDDDSIVWQMILDGSIGILMYDNWLAMEGYQSGDRKSSSWTFYQMNSEEVAFVSSCETDDDGNVICTFNFGMFSHESTANADGSGSFLIYNNGNLLFESHWDSSGNGWWKKYNSSGNEIAGGTWGSD
ncbi:MAG: hypothetical protein AB7W47_09270 [Calditrichaceae bacterium]